MGFSCEGEGNTTIAMRDKDRIFLKVYYDGGARYTMIEFNVSDYVFYYQQNKY